MRKGAKILETPKLTYMEYMEKLENHQSNQARVKAEIEEMCRRLEDQRPTQPRFKVMSPDGKFTTVVENSSEFDEILTLRIMKNFGSKQKPDWTSQGSVQIRVSDVPDLIEVLQYYLVNLS